MINLIKLYKGIKSRYTIHRILMGSKLSNFNISTGYTLDISDEKHTSYEKEWNILFNFTATCFFYLVSRI